ncbi:hypothetical protein GX586_16540, partial [bacterium]|nr:hypothetical protein [bacterium]
MKALLAATLLLPAVTAHSAHAAPARTDHQVLARVELTKSRTELRLPVHAWLLDARGVEYLLVLARENDIALSGAHYMVIDTNAGNRAWLIVMPKARRARQRMLDMAGVLYDDGRQFIARADGTNAEYYAGHGCEIERMSATPLVFTRQAAALGMPAATPKPLAADPLVASLMAQVAESNLYRELAGLTGVEPVTIGGVTVVITSRHTTSGVPFQKDTQYAFERLGALGLDVSYHYWTKSGYSNRNVIAVK